MIGVVYPDFSAWPKWDWVADGLRECGQEVHRARTLDEAAAIDADADILLFCHRCAGMNATDLAEAAKGRRAFWASWFFDLMATEPNRPLDEQPLLFGTSSSGQRRATAATEAMRVMDLVLVKERSLLDEYRRIGVAAAWADQACPAWLGECEHRESPEWDVLFWGGGLSRQRNADIDALIDNDFSVAWAGFSGDGSPPPGALSLPFCQPRELPGLASSAACVLCVDQRHDLDGYWSDRLWHALGMGACVVRRWSPGLPADAPMMTYETIHDLCGLVSAMRRNQKERQRLGAQARWWTMGGNTYGHRCREVLKLCWDRIMARRAPSAAGAALSRA